MAPPHVFYLIVGAGGLVATLATRFEPRMDMDLTLPGHPEVFAIGDMVRVRDPGGEPVALPGLAPVAPQQGRDAASVVRARLRRREYGAFRYHDKGNLATIGRAASVADIKGVRLSGFPAGQLGCSSTSGT